MNFAKIFQKVKTTGNIIVVVNTIIQKKLNVEKIKN